MNTDERNWILLARGGDADAFCRLYGLYRGRLYRYAFYRLRSETDAEDAVSECVLSAWKQIRSLREPDGFPAWIFRILSGCCARLIRQQIDRRQQADLDAPDAPEEWKAAATKTPNHAEMNTTSPAGSAFTSGDADTWLILQEALSQLSEEDRNILLLSAVGGLKSKEIAALTGLAAGSVRSRLSRSLQKIRGYLE